MTAQQMPRQHSFVTALKRNTLVVQPAGMSEMVEVQLSSVKRCRGAGVLVPGPLKLDKRCRDKIVADYEGKEPWPPAASLFDIVRCMTPGTAIWTRVPPDPGNRQFLKN